MLLLIPLLWDGGGLTGMADEDVSEQDLIFLRRAIELACEARADGRHPLER